MKLFNGYNFSLIYSIGGAWVVVPCEQPNSINSLATLSSLKRLRARREVNKKVVSSYREEDKKVDRVHIYPTGFEPWKETPLPCGLSVAGFGGEIHIPPAKTMRDAINQCKDPRMVVLSRGKWWAIDLHVSHEKVLIDL